MSKLMQCVFCGGIVTKDERIPLYTNTGKEGVRFAGYCHPGCWDDNTEENTPGAVPTGDPT